MLNKEFLQYCKLNNIDNIEEFAEQVFQKGFVIVKYGEVPQGIKVKDKIIEVEKIVEKPVEKIVEIPVEKIIERPVEVVKEITNFDELNKLKEENNKLKQDLETITKSLENFGKKGKMMGNSNLSSLYDE